MQPYSDTLALKVKEKRGHIHCDIDRSNGSKQNQWSVFLQPIVNDPRFIFLLHASIADPSQ